MYTRLSSENVALNKPTTQKQKNKPNEGDPMWPSLNAVDGKKECATVDSTTVSVSGYAEYPWWQVDLEALYDINYITIYGRADGQAPGTSSNTFK